MRRGFVAVVAIMGLGLMAAGPLDRNPTKPGLWEVSSIMNIPGMSQMPDLSQLPPEVRAQLQGIQMQGNTVKVRQCLTEEDVRQSALPDMEELKDCALTKMKVVGKVMDTEMTCNGEVKGKVKMKMTFISDDHYKGDMHIQGIAQGRPMQMTSQIEGRRIARTCTK